MLNPLICWWDRNSNNKNLNSQLYCLIETIREVYAPTSIPVSITICVSVSLCCRSRAEGKSVERSGMTTWNEKHTFAEIQEHGLKQGTRGRTALQPPELSQTTCTVERSHKGSGFDGLEMLCSGKSGKHTYLTHGYSPRPGTEAIYCSYLRYILCWLSWLLMTWDSNENGFIYHLGQWNALPQWENAKQKSVGGVYVWVFLPVMMHVASHVYVHVYMCLCVCLLKIHAQVRHCPELEPGSSSLLGYQIWKSLNNQETLSWNVFAFLKKIIN